jgi:hypothetical protein
MAFIHDNAFDAALDYIADNADRLDICTSEPANFAGIAAVSIAGYALTTGDGNGDYTIVAGSPSGRALRLEAQTGNNGTGDGDADFWALSDGSAVLYASGPADGDSVNNGSPVNVSQSVVVTFPDATT